MKILISASNMVHIKNFHQPYIDAFKNDGHEVYVLANGEGADFNIGFKKRSLSIKNAFLSLKIRRLIKKEKFDIIYLHTTLCAFWVRLALKGLKNRPVVVNTVHGYLFGKGFGSLHNKLYSACERLVRNQTDYIAVMNNEDEIIAKENSLCKGEIYKIDGMGIDFSKKEIISATPSHPPENLVYVGELNKRKNQIFLVKALKRLEGAHLTLVGDGKEKEAILKYIKKEGLEKRVTVTGFTKEVGKYLSLADMYVSASKIEGLPFNILEAMKAGLPIVASKTKGQEDLLPDECLYEAENEDDFINHILNSSQEASYDIRKYELDLVLEKNMQIYKSCQRKEKISQKTR